MIKNDKLRQNERIFVRVESDIGDIVPGYLENRRKDIKSILDALEQGNYEGIRILGHSMKGSGGGYGFDAITDIGGFLEQAAKDKNPGEVRKWADELSTYLELLELIYE